MYRKLKEGIMIVLENNGVYRRVVSGFSWKFLFFGWLYSLVRGDIKGFFGQLLIDVFVVPVIFWLSFGVGVASGSLVVASLCVSVYPVTRFLIAESVNRNYLMRLAEKGWKVNDYKNI